LTAPVLGQLPGSFQSSPALLEPGFIMKNESIPMLETPITNTGVSSWSNHTFQDTNLLHGI